MDRTHPDPAQPDAQRAAAIDVRHLRQVLLWPLRLMPLRSADPGRPRRVPWQVLHDLGDASPRRDASLNDDSALHAIKDGTALPYGADHFADFEQRCCCDRFGASTSAAPNTRYLCSGHALIVIGDAHSELYGSRDRGVLAQLQHQHFMLFLIAHFQKAALLVSSDRLVEALKNLAGSSARSAAASRAFCAQAPRRVSRGVRAGAGARAVPPVHPASRARPALRRGQGARRRHERLP